MDLRTTSQRCRNSKRPSSLIITAAAPACSVGSTPFSWDEFEPLPHCDLADNRIPTVCYSRHLKAHLLRGTFVLLLPPSNNISHAGGAGIGVARIVDVLETPTITTPPSVKVNIFKANYPRQKLSFIQRYWSNRIYDIYPRLFRHQRFA